MFGNDKVKSKQNIILLSLTPLSLSLCVSVSICLSFSLSIFSCYTKHQPYIQVETYKRNILLKLIHSNQDKNEPLFLIRSWASVLKFPLYHKELFFCIGPFWKKKILFHFGTPLATQTSYIEWFHWISLLTHSNSIFFIPLSWLSLSYWQLSFGTSVSRLSVWPQWIRNHCMCYFLRQVLGTHFMD